MPRWPQICLLDSQWQVAMALAVRTLAGEERPLTFGSCLFDTLGLPSGVNTHPSVLLDQFVLPSSADEGDSGLHLTLSLGDASTGEARGVPLGHSPLCPAHHTKVDVTPSTDVRDRDRGRQPRVQLAVVVLIEAHDPGTSRQEINVFIYLFRDRKGFSFL